ncbi:hypothetical protein ACLIBG_11125 [Virgibacillus sp. W0181]|uniref:hypothetical protein n=1 Tax=Virgibacillus sp. W0181 TaxID=3391581 RepID=UPI003F446023
MKHRIAVFGPTIFMERLHQISKQTDFPDLIIEPYVYQDPKEAPYLIEKAQNAHVLLFSGPLPYAYARGALKKTSQPVEVVEYNENNIVFTMLQMKHKYNVDFSELSMDIIDEETLQRVSDELGFPLHVNYVKDFAPLLTGDANFDLESIYRFHYDLWKQGKTKLAVTSIHLVRDRLENAGVPTIQMIDPDNNTLEALKLVQQSAELYMRKSSQVAVGLISVENKSDIIEDTAIYEKVYQFLVKMCRNANGSVRKIDESNFIVNGTQGSVSILTEGYKRCTLQEGAREALHIELAIGFGLGTNFNEAEKHSTLAHKYAVEKKQGTIVINENKELLGPIGSSDHSIQLKGQNEAILPLAQEMNIPLATLINLKLFHDNRLGEAFSSKDLAAFLQVSRRSSERLLKKLAEANTLKLIGSEQPYTQGRPRSLYRFKREFLNKLSYPAEVDFLASEPSQN